jgi:hypothetical protein
VNDDDGLGKVQGDDLELDAALVWSDPDQPGIELCCCGDPFRLAVRDDVNRMGLSDPVAPRRAKPPVLRSTDLL